MKPVDEQMSVYAAYHRNRWNRCTHFVGVPAIVFAILIPMSRVAVAGDATLAHAFALAALAYYFLLDAALALATAVVTGALLYAARLAAATGSPSSWVWFGAFFAGGWAFQLAGHAREGRKPALLDDLFQIFIAPIFLVAEIFFALGLKRGLREKIEARLATCRSAR